MPIKSIVEPGQVLGFTILLIATVTCVYCYLNQNKLIEHFESLAEKETALKTEYSELQKKYQQNMQEEITTSSELSTLKKKLGHDAKGKVAEGNKVRLYEYDMEKVQAAYNKVSLEVNTLKSYFESLQKEYIKTGKDLDTLKEEYALDKEKCAVVDTNLTKSKMDYSTVQKEVESATNTVAELKKQLGLMTTKSDPLAATLTPVLQERQKEKLEIDKKLAEMGARLKADMAAAEQLKKKLQLDGEKLAELTKKQSLSQQQLVKTQAKFTSGSQEKTKLESELKQLTDAITVNDGINKKLQDDITNLRNRYNKVVSNESAITTKISTVRTKTVNQSIEIKKLQDAIEAINKEKAAVSTTGIDVRKIPGLQIWLDGKDPLNTGSAPPEGTAIPIWKDKSGNQNDMNAQRAASYSAATSSLSFNRSLYNSKNVSVYPIDVFVVVKVQDASGPYDICGLAQNGPDNFNSLTFGEFRRGFWHNGSSGFSRTGNAVATSAETSTNFLLMEWSIANNNFFINRNATQIMSTNTYTWDKGNPYFQLGSRLYVDAGINLIGNIAEVIVFNAQLDGNKRQQVEGYLAKKWSLESLLPPGHPAAKAPEGSAIQIMEATYGGNCNPALKGNRTDLFKGLADGKSSLDYVYDYTKTGGDPAGGCGKNLVIRYSCGTKDIKEFSAPPEAGVGAKISLVCAGGGKGIDVRSIPGLRLWLDGSDPLGNGSPPNDGAKVTMWKDKSNSNFSTTNVNGNPVYNAATKSIKFDGGSSYNLPNGSFPFNNSPYSIFVVVSTVNPGPPGWYLSGGGGQVIGSAFNANQISHSWANGGSELWKAGPVKPITANTPLLVELGYDSSSRMLLINGTVAGSDRPGAINNDQNRNVIGHSPVYGQNLNGNIYEIIIFSSNLSDALRKKVEGSLAWKWGLQSSLPSGHPFQSAAPK